MGKHERQQIEEAEKIIVKILNSHKLSSFDRENLWFEHALAIAKMIQGDFPTIKKARHLGNRYDNTGDILITSNGKRFFLEIKMSHTKTGIGTKANISQDALTENHLFLDKTVSWNKFRQKKNHDGWVNKYLNRFTRYPQKILEITNSTELKEEKARHLRRLKDKGNKKAKNILDNIREGDRGEKIEYLVYLSNKKQRPKNIKRFFILITLGIHTKEALADLMNNKKFFQEIQNLFIYYANYDKGRIVVRKEDAGDKIRRMIKDYSNFKIVFSKNLTHCKIAGIKNGSIEPLLQVVFHWKNIAQGIKTPCLNIFDLTL